MSLLTSSSAASQRQWRLLAALRLGSLILAVPLFAAIILAPVKHGLEEYEVFIGFLALVALPIGAEGIWVGVKRRQVQRALGLLLVVVSGTSLAAVLWWVTNAGPTGMGVLALGSALAMLGITCQVLRALDFDASPR